MNKGQTVKVSGLIQLLMLPHQVNHCMARLSHTLAYCISLRSIDSQILPLVWISKQEAKLSLG